MLIVKSTFQIRCKGTTFFGNMQVLFAKKCVFFAFLVRSVGIFAVIKHIFDLFVLRNRHGFGVDLAVDEVDIFCILQFDTVLIADDHHIVEEDMMNRFAFETLDIDGLLAADTRYIAERDVRPIGEESIFFIFVGSADACSLVGIAGRDEDSRLLHILHDDILAVDIFAPATTSGRRFETATDIRSVEIAVLDYQPLHTAGELGTDDETAVSGIDRIVGDEEIALRSGLYAFLRHAAFHTDSVIAAGYIAIDDERHLHIARIHGIAVLRPVRATDVNAVNNKVLHACGHEMELG